MAAAGQHPGAQSKLQPWGRGLGRRGRGLDPMGPHVPHAHALGTTLKDVHAGSCRHPLPRAAPCRIALIIAHPPIPVLHGESQWRGRCEVQGPNRLCRKWLSPGDCFCHISAKSQSWPPAETPLHAPDCGLHAGPRMEAFGPVWRKLWPKNRPKG